MWTESDTRHTLRVRISLLTFGRTSALVFRSVKQTNNERTASAVRAEMARRKISGRALADGLGWSVASTWRRLNGTTAFRVDELASVADYLDVDMSDLISTERAA